MSTLPSCTTKNSILDADLIRQAKEGALIKLVVVSLSGEKGTYVVAYLRNEPQRPIYLATRRNRKEPKVFVDQTRLINNLANDFAGIPVQILLPHETPPAQQI
ncbi:hypothetical protein [Delftia sp. GW456-R20]|uniref:hypothetical protein n=1 Tax=Delftia sp. GW456-R20 TaxID=1827145 RepID=UPI0012E7252E|nr:hypothetical protein [Delftia sp. GW456-R20]